MPPVPVQDIWLSPNGAGMNTDWGAIEKLLDSDGRINNESHADTYWGSGTSAYFWGPGEKPLRRPIANAVEVKRGENWKTMNIGTGKEEDRRKLYAGYLTEQQWPKGTPCNLDTKRILGQIKPPAAHKETVAGSLVLKGLYLAPLTLQQKEEVRKAAHDDILKVSGVNAHVNNLRSVPTGCRITFHADAKKGEGKLLLEKLKKVPTVDPQAILGAYSKFPVRPRGCAYERQLCVFVCRPRTFVRGDAVSGAASEDYDLGAKPASRAGYSAPPSAARASAASTPSRASASSTASRVPGVAGSVKRPVAAGGRPAPPKEEKLPATPAERKKALLGKVMSKTKAQLTKIESETPYVPATHELQKRQAAIAEANARIAEKEGVREAVAREDAKASLQPPCRWQGALVRTEGGRRNIENFEIDIVELNKDIRCLVGRAHIQNGKMDVTYQAKLRCLIKDGELKLEVVLDSSGVCKGSFVKPGVISGTFKFPNGSGTFKLMRLSNDL